MKIVFNNLIQDRIENIGISVRQLNTVVRFPTIITNDGKIVEAKKDIKGKQILVVYTVQGREIKIASVEEILK